MTVCGGWSAIKHDHTGSTAVTLFCRSWQCPDCQPYRLRALKRMAADGQPTTFITLTVNPATGQSPTDRARELSHAWKLVVKRARRQWKKAPIEYLAVFEETKKGEPHLHILARAPFIPQRWLSRQMDELIKAPIVDIRQVKSAAHAANYVAKYVGKGPKSFGSLKRYWATPKYDLQRDPVPKSISEFGSGWHVVNTPVWLIKETWEKMGRVVVEARGGAIFAPIGKPIGATAPPVNWPNKDQLVGVG